MKVLTPPTSLHAALSAAPNPNPKPDYNQVMAEKMWKETEANIADIAAAAKRGKKMKLVKKAEVALQLEYVVVERKLVVPILGGHAADH